MDTRVCKKCDEELAINQFPIVNGRHSRECRGCKSLYVQKFLDCKKNRVISSIINWPIPT